MLLRFIAKPEEFAGNYFLNGGLGTLESFLHERINEEYSPTEIALMMKHYYKDLLAFLAELPVYYEWEQYIFVHAGVDLGKKDWHDGTEEDFLLDPRTVPQKEEPHRENDRVRAYPDLLPARRQ